VSEVRGSTPVRLLRRHNRELVRKLLTPIVKRRLGHPSTERLPPAIVVNIQDSGITPSGLRRLRDERRFLLTRERRAVTEVKSGPGDWVVLRAPGTTEQLEILEVRYERILVEPFSEPPGAEAAPKTRSRTGG
jgi:hypothetical protein